VRNTLMQCNIPDRLTTKLLLVLTNTVIFGSESHGIHDHILLSNGSRSHQGCQFGRFSFLVLIAQITHNM
jgi:hypothetical protein